MGRRIVEEKARKIESIEPVERSSEAVEIARAEDESRAREEFRTLFEGIDQGTTISEIILNNAGEAVDCRILEANAQFEQVTGLSRAEALSGKTVRELIPTLEDSWVRKLGGVAVTGEPSRYESYVAVLDRWLDIYSFRIGDPALRRVVCLFKDITTRQLADQALRDSERIKSYLLKLSDVLRPIADPMEVMRKGPEVLARELDVSAAGYVELSADSNSAVFGGQYADGRMPELAGECRLSDFGEGFGLSLAAGEDIFSSDVYKDPRGPAGGAEKTRGFNIRAVAGIPLIKNGRLVSLFYAVHFEPRPWLESEREIVRQTAERTWATVERVRADVARRESEERYRTLFNSIDQGYAVAEVLSDGSDAPADVRFIEANSVFKEQAGLTNLGQSAREVIPNFDDDWASIYAHVAKTGESVRFEKRSRGLGRWFNVFVSRVGGEGSRLVNIIKEDVTARKESEVALRASEEKQAYKLRLNEAMRTRSDPTEIQEAALQILSERLRADRAFCAGMNVESGHLLVERNIVREGTPSIAGCHRLEVLSWIRESSNKPEPVVVEDVRTTPLLP
jgi:PAS domain S-box-containing protein